MDDGEVQADSDVEGAKEDEVSEDDEKKEGEDDDDLDWDDVFDGMADADAADGDSDVSGEASEDEEEAAPAPVPVKKAKKGGKKKKDNAMLKEPAKTAEDREFDKLQVFTLLLLKTLMLVDVCRKQNQKNGSGGRRQCDQSVFANERMVILWI